MCVPAKDAIEVGHWLSQRYYETEHNLECIAQDFYS